MFTRKQASGGVDRLPDEEVSRTSTIMALGGYTSAARMKEDIYLVGPTLSECALRTRVPEPF
jgi:hypothetical protein